MIKKSISYFCANGIGIAIGIISTAMLTKAYSVGEYGYFQLLNTLIGSFAIFSLSGFNVFIQKATIENNIQFLFEAIKRILFISLFSSAVISVGLLYFFPVYDSKLVILAVIVFFISSFDRLDAVLQGGKRFKEIVFFNLSRQIGYLLLIVFICLFRADLNLLLYVFVLYTCFFSLVRFFYSFKDVQVMTQKNSITFTAGRVYFEKVKRPIYLNSALVAWGTLANWIDRLILGTLSPEMLAILHVSQLIPKQIKDNAKSLFAVPIHTWIAQGEEYAVNKIWRYKYLILFSGVALSCVLLATSYLLVKYLFGDKYLGSIFYMNMFGLTIGFQFLLNFVMSTASLGDSLHAFNKVLLIGPTTKIVLSIILVPLYRLNGALVSNIISELAVYSYSFYWFYHRYRYYEHRQVHRL